MTRAATRQAPSTRALSGRRLRLAGWLALAVWGAGCRGEVGELPAAEPIAPSDPRGVAGFDVPLPQGATVRAGRTEGGRSTVFATAEDELGEVRAAAREALAARGWAVTTDGDTLVASAAGEERARVRVVRGVSDLVRIEASEPRGGRARGEAPPVAWRRVRRAPLPAPPRGVREPRCVAAMEGACAAYAAHGGADALDCRMDHRGVCSFVTPAAYHRRAIDDAEARLSEALRCHDRTFDDEARAETAFLVRVERLAADAVRARARRAGVTPSARLVGLLAASEALAEGAPSTNDWWPEIPDAGAP